MPLRANETLLDAREGRPVAAVLVRGRKLRYVWRLSEGSATMKVNDALEADEVEDGYVLTCQAVPDTPSVTVHYED